LPLCELRPRSYSASVCGWYACTRRFGIIEAIPRKERGETIKKVIGWSMILLGLLVLAGVIADSKIGGWLRPAGPAALSAPLTDIDRVSVRVESGQVRVVLEDRPDLAVAVSGNGSARTDAALVRHGSELQVRVATPWWRWPRFSVPNPVEIRLPERFAEALAVEVSQGNLAIAGGSPDRPATLKLLDLKVRTGKVELRNLRVGTLTYNGQTGALSADRVEAGEAALRVVSGKMDLTHFAGALRADVTAGHVAVQFDALSGPITVEQVSGELVLGLPADAGFTVDARVSRGLIRSDLPLEGTTGSSQNALRGTHGDGTHLVYLRLGSGSITLR
jgi:lia operon protein LiaG